MENTDKKTKILNRIFYITLVVLILASVGVTFYKIVILKDYQIIAETSCDIETEENCFAFGDEETGETSYYKIINKNANTIYLCEATEERLGCNEELSCIEGEENCSYTYCDRENLAEGEVCADAIETTETSTESEKLNSAEEMPVSEDGSTIGE